MTLSGDRLREAEEFLHQKIPLTRAMGVRVLGSSEAMFAVEAPVALNHNHLQTGFGGSINAVATLAAYAFLWLELHDAAVEIVVAESTIRFRAPVHEAIHAICKHPEEPALSRFKKAVAEKGKGRIELQVEVVERETVAAHFNGSFVAIRRSGI
ncbi:MAG TPA: YiiD C-terminal domain-containing protein [Chthoniobacterales bacterium]